MAAWFGRKPPETTRNAQRAGGRVSDILVEKAIVIADPSADKNRLIEQLAQRVCEAHALGEAAPFIAKVLEREQGISTTLDTGLSLPHARIESLGKVVAALGVAPQGIREPKQPELLIRVMFLFYSPNKQEFFSQHLQLLRGVATLFEPALIDQIQRAPDARSVLDAIRAREG